MNFHRSVSNFEKESIAERHYSGAAADADGQQAFFFAAEHSVFAAEHSVLAAEHSLLEAAHSLGAASTSPDFEERAQPEMARLKQAISTRATAEKRMEGFLSTSPPVEPTGAQSGIEQSTLIHWFMGGSVCCIP